MTHTERDRRDVCRGRAADRDNHRHLRPTGNDAHARASSDRHHADKHGPRQQLRSLARDEGNEQHIPGRRECHQHDNTALLRHDTGRLAFDERGDASVMKSSAVVTRARHGT